MMPSTAKHRCNRLCGFPTVIHVFQPVQRLLEERKEGAMSCIGFASCGSIPLCMKSSFIPLLHQWGKALGTWTHHLCWRRSKGTMPIPSLAHCPSSPPTPFSPTYFQTTTFSVVGSTVEPSLHEGTELFRVANIFPLHSVPSHHQP